MNEVELPDDLPHDSFGEELSHLKYLLCGIQPEALPFNVRVTLAALRKAIAEEEGQR